MFIKSIHELMSDHCCPADEVNLSDEKNNKLKRMFWIVLVLNAAMFFVEFFYGLIAGSNALLADSLDMLGDAFVYGISLLVVTRSIRAKANASLIKGIVTLLLGLFVIGQSVYKILVPSTPQGETITLIGILALVVNLGCFWLLTKYKNGDLNVQSAWICSRNDVLGNASVIIAGFLVIYFGSMWPDIIIGLGIAMVVLSSAIGIIKESVSQRKV